MDMMLGPLIPLLDLGLKALLRRRLGGHAVTVGPFGRVQMLNQRIWLARLDRRLGGPAMWAIWVAAALPLVVLGLAVPSAAAFVGLLLGGSFSNGLESSLRGTVSDYICLGWWPAFNLADVAVTVGSAGLAVQLLIL
jgi:hypothetical protein